jgi:hypothetical protein
MWTINLFHSQGAFEEGSDDKTPAIQVLTEYK